MRIPEINESVGFPAKLNPLRIARVVWRRTRRLRIAAAIALPLLVLLHGPLLTLLAHGLIAPRSSDSPDAVLILGGDACYDLAEHLYAQGEIRTVLLRNRPPNRLVRLGLAPSGAQTAIRAFGDAVPREAIEILPRGPMWDRVAERLEAHPGTQIAVISSAFRSREARLHARRAFDDPAHFERILWRPLDDAEFTASNWWKERNGVKDFLNGWLGLAYAWTHPEGGKSTPDDWEPDVWAKEVPKPASYLDITSVPERADWALVLAGAADRRPFGAAALYRAGRVGGVLLTQARPSYAVLRGHVERQEILAKKAMEHHGVPTQAVRVLPGEVRSTLDEARTLAQFLEEAPGATVVVVTTTYHTRRARFLFRDVLGEDAKRVSFVGVPPEDFRDESWWETEEGFITYSRETIKLAAYGLRYGVF